MAEDISETLRPIITVLCGTRDPAFDYEDLLSLFQFKLWLQQEFDDTQCFSDAAAQFAMMTLTREFNLLRGRQPELPPSQALIQILNEEMTAKLFNASMNRKGLFYNLYNDLSLAQFAENFDVQRSKIQSLNVLTTLRLWICKTPDIAHTLTQALDAYERGCKKYEYKYGRTNIAAFERNRRNRVAFLWVASQFDTWIFEIADSRTDMRKVLRKQIRKVGDLKQYFAKCAFVCQLLLKEDKPTVRFPLIHQWAGVEPVESIDGITPLSEDEKEFFFSLK